MSLKTSSFRSRGLKDPFAGVIGGWLILLIQPRQILIQMRGSPVRNLLSFQVENKKIRYSFLMVPKRRADLTDRTENAP